MKRASITHANRITASRSRIPDGDPPVGPLPPGRLGTSLGIPGTAPPPTEGVAIQPPPHTYGFLVVQLLRL